MKNYFIQIDNSQQGPFNFEDLKSKQISKDTFVWLEGIEDWKKAGEIEELKQLFISSTPPPFKQTVKNPPPFQKSKTPPPFSKKSNIPPPISKTLTEYTNNDIKPIDSPIKEKEQKTVNTNQNKVVPVKRKYILAKIVTVLAFCGIAFWIVQVLIPGLTKEVTILKNNYETRFSNNESSENSLKEQDGSEKQLENSRLDQVEQPAETIYAWGCHQCSQVKYQNEEPDIHNCPVGYTYNGGSGSGHGWRNYGEFGTNNYSCEFCGLRISLKSSSHPDYSTGTCVSHEYGQALTSAHHWQ